MKHNNSSLMASIGEYIKRWGNPTSVGLFDPACEFFSLAGIEGVIGYRMDAKCAIVIGDPVCAPEVMPHLTQSFHDFCEKNGKTVVYLAVSEKFANWALQNKCRSIVSFGEEVILDPHVSPINTTGHDARALRNKYNQATRDGIQIKEYTGQDSALEKKMEEVAQAWLAGRTGMQVYFSKVDLFGDRAHKRWFYAEKNNEMLGVLMINRIDAREGWFLNMLMAKPEAPRIVTDIIVLAALEILRAEGCRFFSIGSTPGKQLQRIEGLGRFSQWLAKYLYKTAQKFLRLDSKQRFWLKFKPRMEPSYVLFSRSRIGLREIQGLMRALNIGR